MDKETLKPCPFCKGGAHLISYSNAHLVSCKDCGASTKLYHTREQAIAAWSKRANEEKDG